MLLKYRTKFEGDTSDQVLKSTCLTSCSCSFLTTPRDDLSPSLTSMWAWRNLGALRLWESAVAGSSPAARILKLRDRGSLNRLRMVILRQTIRSPILLVFGWMDGLSNLKSIRISNPTRRGGDSQQCASRREPHLKGGN